MDKYESLIFKIGLLILWVAIIYSCISFSGEIKYGLYPDFMRKIAEQDKKILLIREETDKANKNIDFLYEVHVWQRH